MKIQNMSFPLGFVFLALLLASQSCVASNSSVRPADASVLESYQKIQVALAHDSLKDVTANAAAISKAVKNDPDKKIPMLVAEQADKLSKDTDIKAARDEFKNLSSTLISYLEKSNLKNVGYEENYCPMVKASWLQKGKDINNPYLGKSMPGCGTPKRSF